MSGIELQSVLFLIISVICSQSNVQGQSIYNDRYECPTYTCDESNCELPDCLCPSSKPPAGLDSSVVPQFVLFTFNDVVKREFSAPFTQIFTKNRRNPSGRRITATLFVSDMEGTGSTISTDYCLARRLYEEGHELASHSKSHRIPSDWWKNDASVRDWTEQLSEQREQIFNESKLQDDKHHIKGARAPFLQSGGEKQFVAIDYDKNFTYDSSLVLSSPVADGGFWPFTMDYGVKDLHCEVGICPANCYKKLWEIPLHIMEGPLALQCMFLDYCFREQEAEVITAGLKKIYNNRHDGNKSPLVLNFNMVWFEKNENAQEGLSDFLDYILQNDDTYVVTIQQLLDYMRAPVPIPALDSIRSLMPAKDGKVRDTKACSTNRGSGLEEAFFISGNFLLICEILFLSVTALVLIARDSE